MAYTLSPEQLVVAQALQEQTTSDTKYFDIHTALQSLQVALIEAINKDQKVLLHIPENHENFDAIISSLSSSKLSELMIESSSALPVSERDLIKLRSTLKGNTNTDCIITNILTNTTKANLLTKIQNSYHHLNKLVLSNIKFKDFALSLIYDESRVNKNEAFAESSLEFSSQEFRSVKEQIASAANLYQNQYDLYEHLNLLKEDIWKLSDSELKQKKDRILELSVKAKQIVQKFEFTTSSLILEIAHENNLNIAHLEELLELHEKACLSYQITEKYTIQQERKSFSLFGKKQKVSSNTIYVDAFDQITEKIQTISTSWFDQLHSPTDEEIDFIYIMNFIKDIRSYIPIHQQNISKNLVNSIHRINKINTTSKAVIHLDEEMKELVSQVNQESFLIEQFKHNALSFNKQKELSTALNQYLEKCCVLLGEGSDYMRWKTFFVNSHPSFKTIFPFLKDKEKPNWIQAFEYWYFDQILYSFTKENDYLSELKNLYTCETIINGSSSESAVNKIMSQRLASSESLKSESKELYNTLFKKKTPPSSSWKDISLMARPFMQKFFPIHYQSSLTSHSEYDLIISFDKRPEIMETQLQIHYFSPIQTSDIENRHERKDMFLYLNNYNYEVPLSELTSSQKLKASKKLAKFILSLNQQVKIYQIKTANIISLLPLQDDAKLEKELESYGLNTIDTHGNIYERLTESILFTERKPFLILKDELFNSDMPEYVLWQMKMREVFEKAGYTILSLNTAQQIENNHFEFQKFLFKLSGEETAKKKMIEDTAISTKKNQEHSIVSE